MLPEGSEERRKLELDLMIARDLSRDGKVDEVMKIASSVLDRDPSNAPALFFVAWAFIKADRFGIAYNLLKRSLDIKQKFEALNNLALTAIGMQRIDEAEDILIRAMRRPELKMNDKTSALNNLALCAVYKCNPKKAIEYAQQSLEIDPDQHDVRESLGYAQLMLHNFEEGWLGHEAIIGKAKARKTRPPYAGCPYWIGEEVNSLFVCGEQGVGDEICFASALPDALKVNPNIVLECDAKLEGLFKRSFPSIEVHGSRYTKDRSWMADRKFDAHCLSGTFMKHYRNTVDDFPGTPYLVPDEEMRIQWRALLDTLPGLKVGIAWRGGLANTFSVRRSVTLETFLPILRTEGVTWVSLEYKDPTDEIEAMRETHGIEIKHWKRASESKDYDETAALVSELDLVITVTTAVVHLCGALGKTAYVMVPSKPRWFYGIQGKSNPFYKSIEIFRQTDKWPIEQIKDRLLAWTGKQERKVA